MRVLVTGASGFAGGWLCRELTDAGHEAIPAPPSAELDIADVTALQALMAATRPDAIAHLAGVSSHGDVSRDPLAALRTTVGGTQAVIEAARAQPPGAALLLVSSAEVYAPPDDPATVLSEASPVGPRHPYGLLKLAAESVAIAAAALHGLRLAVVRPFGHVGPGQRPASAVASFARRVAAVRHGEADGIAVGNLDIERDIGDVRDYVRAYRLLLEELDAGHLGLPAAVYTVATGRAVSLRRVLKELCRLAGIAPTLRVDPSLVRADDPPRLVGDSQRLTEATGWTPRIALETTLADVMAEHLRAR